MLENQIANSDPILVETTADLSNPPSSSLLCSEISKQQNIENQHPKSDWFICVWCPSARLEFLVTLKGTFTLDDGEDNFGGIITWK